MPDDCRPQFELTSPPSEESERLAAARHAKVLAILKRMGEESGLRNTHRDYPTYAEAMRKLAQQEAQAQQQHQPQQS